MEHRDGCRLSPGALSPMLHALERNGYLVSRRATPAGRTVPRRAQTRLHLLYAELIERR
jgi:DNA-binding PadR family transcriptional regulator